jgi:hypothetical protein
MFFETADSRQETDRGRDSAADSRGACDFFETFSRTQKKWDSGTNFDDFS